MTEQIIFEDDHIIVLNKPAGVASQSDNTENNSIEDSFKDKGEVYIINRLDQRVSGLMLLAKNKESAAILSENIKNKTFTKKYKAIVANKPEPANGTIESFIEKRKSKAFIGKTETPQSQKAKLSYKTLVSSERYHLLEIDLFTGRFHQIRAQLASIGCPILGDLKYGFKRSSPDGSIFLQSYYLRFEHPSTKEILNFELEQPEIWTKYGF